MSLATLQVVNLHAQCAQVQILNGISLYAMSGEVIALLGRNGSRRRAALRAIIGQAEARQGSIRIIGKETIHNDSSQISSLGLGMLPTRGGIVPHLTCEENLLLPDGHGETLGGAMSLTEIYELCPDLKGLKSTLGTRLSGAEKRMLAIARLLRAGISVLLMDDISDGLAPVMTQAFSDMLMTLKRQGYTIIMGARDLDFCEPLADRFYVMQGGQITEAFPVNELPARRARLSMFLTGNTYDTH